RPHSFLIYPPAIAAIYTFPYTTLFRSCPCATRRRKNICRSRLWRFSSSPWDYASSLCACFTRALGTIMKTTCCLASRPAESPARSEEHTSELQSHLNLVCRLLLEKKKK